MIALKFMCREKFPTTISVTFIHESVMVIFVVHFSGAGDPEGGKGQCSGNNVMTLILRGFLHIKAFSFIAIVLLF